YSMLTWSSASLCSLAVLTIFWNVSADRVLLTSLLTALACWWLCHGWSNRLHVTLLAGWVCALIAVGLSIEPTLFATRPLLNSTDWFTLPRIGSISLTCLLAGGLILLLKRSAWRQGPPADKHTILGWSAPDASQLLSMGLVASGVGLVGSMGLTVLASLVPWSQPAYGGNWAPILLIIFGTATLSAGLLLPKWLPSPTEQSLQPQSGRSLTKVSLTAFNGATISTTAVLVAQLVLLLGVVRFCQTGIAIPDWLASLRPWRSWAIGTGILALIWSGLAGCLRWSWKTTDQPGEWFYQSHARLLCIGAIGLAWLTGLAWWTHMDHWTMASRLGWQIPVTWMLSFCALRRTNWRELSILSLLVWLATCLIVYGNSNLWWTRLGASASCGLIVFVLLAALATYELAILCLPNKFHWIGGGPRWAEGAALHGLWPVYILFLAIASTIILGTSLTDASAQFSQDGFWLPQVTWLRSAISLLALSSLTAFTLWWNAQRSSSVVGWLITVPIGLAGIVSCHAPVPYPIPVFLWLLAAYVIVSEVLLASKIHMLLLRVVRRGNQPSISQAAVEQAIRSHATERSWFHRTWLASLGTIIATTALLWVNHWIGGLPDVLSPQVAQPSSWTDLMQNFLCLWLWSGPVLTVFLSQWIAALTRAQSHRKISSWGWAFAVWCAWMVTCAYSDRSEAFLLLLARGCCLTLSATAMLTLGFTCLRNWLGLRALAPQSPTLQLISKACKGARWRQAESATWNLWTGAMVAASVLSISAVVAIAFYPQTQSSLLHLLGSGWTFLGLLGTLCVLRILGRQSDWSGFGLVAISLGLLAPIAAASYGSWLWDNPASRFALANNHEPYRLLIGLWLTALISGLCLRMKAVWQTKQLSPSGDWAWITLASVVGLMAMIGLWSDLLWSTIELSILAGIIAISSEVSKQTWRGYVAAMISCIAYLPWLADTSANLRFGSLWQMMAALVGVGLLTMVTRLVFCKKISKSVERDTTGQITIDRIVCLTVAVACCAMSGIWILLQPDTVSAEWTTTVVILGLTVSNLLLAVLRLWDSGPSERGLSLYFAMIALVLVIANSLAAFQQWPRWQSELAWFFGLLSVLAVIGLLTRRLLSAPDRWLRWMPGSLFIDQERLRRNCDQMLQFHLICGLLSLPPSLWLALFIPEQPWRTAASLLPMLGALATVSIAPDQKYRWVRSSVLLMSSVTLVLLAWIDLPSAWSVRNQPQSWHFGHRLFLAFTALSVAYPLIAWRRLGDSFWAKTLVQGGWILTGLSMLTGSCLVLGSVFEVWDRYPASIGFMPKLITLVAWILTIAKLLQLAIEPMGLDKRLKATWRYASVYAAELSLVAASASIYQHFPEFFSGQFVQWWPLAVFGIAVLSVAVGWWAQRTDLPFLADPIQRSSLLLPLIPLVAVWWTPMSQSGWQWSDWHSYCWLLIMAAGLYGLHGWTRQSSRWLAVSVGLAQLSYWSFLHSTPNLRFYEHPQFWLLPPALGGLAFVEWHRKQLAPSVVTTMRYVTVLLAYLSSSTEVFFKAFEGNLWQPLWLLMLALLGVAAGMFLQVRAFLYCGVTFVLVALVGMVRQAAQAIDQVWPWWAFGIATGILLIVALGYLEKNRSQVLGYLEELKRWQQ
ncbi:MAG TPA: hypothetical protein DCF63_01925, partial [Planctomycetaceae bacterium]|nr:hypothetical protein [Planctomycetaceae bacterium]